VTDRDRARLSGWILLCAGRAALFVAHMLSLAQIYLFRSAQWGLLPPRGRYWWALASILPPSIIVLGAVGINLRIRGQRYLAAAAGQLLAGDPRLPVVYLRSFEVDDVTANASDRCLFAADVVVAVTAEEQVARAFTPVGPFVAVGQPGEVLPYLGAVRVYAGEEWRQVVLELLGRARLVVLCAGLGAGLRWELDQVRRHVPPERVVLLATLDAADYEQFCVVAASHLLVTLPPYPPSRRHEMAIKCMLYFEHDWTPRLVRLAARRRYALLGSAIEIGLVHGLRPVYERIGVKWPGVTLRLPFSLYLTRRHLKRAWLYLAVSMLAVMAASALRDYLAP
jgi:hypothetical protein